MIKGLKCCGVTVLLVLCALVTGCAAPQEPLPLERQQQRTLSAILCSGADAAHVQVIQEGDIVTLILPSDALFEPHSAHFSAGYRKRLAPVACALQKSSEHRMIKVAAFTDDWSLPRRNRLLSGQRASAVVAYLTRQTIDARFLYAVGYGHHWPVADNTTEQGRLHNRRIEISFRHLHT